MLPSGRACSHGKPTEPPKKREVAHLEAPVPTHWQAWQWLELHVSASTLYFQTSVVA